MACGKPIERTASIGGRSIRYELHRSPRRRKNITLAIDDGQMRVLAPDRTPLRQIDEIVQARADWIEQRLAAPPPARLRDQLRPGGSLPLLGQRYPVVNGPRAFRFHDDPASDASRHFSLNPYAANVVESAEAWFRQEARTKIGDQVAHWAPTIRVEPTRIQIRDQKTRWGSASAKGTLSFNWRLIFAPPEIIDYVVVHELCHLRQPDHSRAYWRLVESVMPDAQIHRRRLREIGRTLAW